MTAKTLIYKVAETADERAAAFQLRERVFLDELKRERSQEADAYDHDACHVIATDEAGPDSDIVGTLRLYKLDPGDQDIKIGRVAVRIERRGEGIGTAMMHRAHVWAAAEGYRTCYLHAEVNARAFYERLGYLAEGVAFMESGAGHIRMRRACADGVKTENAGNN